MSTNVNFNKHVVLTQAQYDARKTAGTLQAGIIYDIKDYVPSGASYTAGDGIAINSNEISVDIEGDGGLEISGSGMLQVDTSTIATVSALNAGLATKSAVSGTASGDNWSTITINGTAHNIPQGGGTSYTAGDGIAINSNAIEVDLLGDGGLAFGGDNNQLCVDESQIQHKLTQGSGIAINGNTISNSGVTSIGGGTGSISTGYGVEYDSDLNVLKAKVTSPMYTDANGRITISFNPDTLTNDAYYGLTVNTTNIQPKLTAGSNITISDDNVISATGGGSSYTAGTGINISDGIISAKVAAADPITTTSSGALTLYCGNGLITAADGQLKVRPDGTTITFNSNGQLQANTSAATKYVHNIFMAWDSSDGHSKVHCMAINESNTDFTATSFSSFLVNKTLNAIGTVYDESESSDYDTMFAYCSDPDTITFSVDSSTIDDVTVDCEDITTFIDYVYSF